MNGTEPFDLTELSGGIDSLLLLCSCGWALPLWYNLRSRYKCPVSALLVSYRLLVGTSFYAAAGYGEHSRLLGACTTVSENAIILLIGRRLVAPDPADMPLRRGRECAAFLTAITLGGWVAAPFTVPGAGLHPVVEFLDPMVRAVVLCAFVLGQGLRVARNSCAARLYHSRPAVFCGSLAVSSAVFVERWVFYVSGADSAGYRLSHLLRCVVLLLACSAVHLPPVEEDDPGIVVL